MNWKKSLSLSVDALRKHTDIPIKVLPDMRNYYQALARQMADLVKKNNRSGKPTRMILPVGPTQQYPVFAEIVNAERIDCRNVWTFNMDEYLDWQGRAIPESHPMSFRSTMYTLLWDKIERRLRIPKRQMAFPDPRRLRSILSRAACT